MVCQVKVVLPFFHPVWFLRTRRWKPLKPIKLLHFCTTSRLDNTCYTATPPYIGHHIVGHSTFKAAGISGTTTSSGIAISQSTPWPTAQLEPPSFSSSTSSPKPRPTLATRPTLRFPSSSTTGVSRTACGRSPSPPRSCTRPGPTAPRNTTALSTRRPAATPTPGRPTRRGRSAGCRAATTRAISVRHKAA